jgi:hypothetical protein
MFVYVCVGVHYFMSANNLKSVLLVYAFSEFVRDFVALRWNKLVSGVASKYCDLLAIGLRR